MKKKKKDKYKEYFELCEDVWVMATLIHSLFDEYKLLLNKKYLLAKNLYKQE